MNVRNDNYMLMSSIRCLLLMSYIVHIVFSKTTYFLYIKNIKHVNYSMSYILYKTTIRKYNDEEGKNGKSGYMSNTKSDVRCAG